MGHGCLEASEAGDGCTAVQKLRKVEGSMWSQIEEAAARAAKAGPKEIGDVDTDDDMDEAAEQQEYELWKSREMARIRYPLLIMFVVFEGSGVLLLTEAPCTLGPYRWKLHSSRLALLPTAK